MPLAHRSQTAPSEPGRAHGARLLLTDARVALLVLNDGRYRAMERLLGLPKEQVNVATVVAGLVIAEALHARAGRLRRAPPPSLSDMALGASSLREGLYAVSGQSPSETPLVGTLIAIGVVGSLARPVVRTTLRGLRVSSRQLHDGFNHRYRHTIRHGRRHLSRAKHAGRKRLTVLRPPSEQRQAAPAVGERRQAALTHPNRTTHGAAPAHTMGAHSAPPERPAP